MTLVLLYLSTSVNKKREDYKSEVCLFGCRLPLVFFELLSLLRSIEGCAVDPDLLRKLPLAELTIGVNKKREAYKTRPPQVSTSSSANKPPPYRSHQGAGA